MSFPFDSNDSAFPGIEAALNTVQNQYWFGKQEQQTFLPATISGAARDAGNTVTDVLRGGLLLGKVTSTGLYKEWNPTGTDGSEVIAGILVSPLKMTDAGTNTDRWAWVQIAGNLYSDRLLIPANADEGIVADALEYQVVAQLLSMRFILDKHVGLSGNPLTSAKFLYVTAAENTAHAATRTAAQLHNRTVMGTGITAATLTLTVPAAVVGLSFSVFNNSGQTMTITPASGNIVDSTSLTSTTHDITTKLSGTFVGVSAGLYKFLAD